MVKVKPTASQGRITVKTSNDTNVFGIKDNLSEYYAKQAENWAHSEGIVNGIDYSSKYYAEQSKTSAQVASNVKAETQELVDGFDNNVQIAKDNIEENRVNSIVSINNVHNNAVIDIENSSSDAINNITAMRNDVETNIANVVNGYLDTIDASVKALPMFTPIWSDHILNDAAYLRADTFSWHNGDIYTTAYNLLLNEFNSDKSIEELEGNVTYKRTPSGFKIADIEQHENILTTFTMTGKSWFYVLDTEQQRFKLPRTKYSFTGIRDTVGGDVEAGLPSLTSNSIGAHTHSRGTMEIKGTFGALNEFTTVSGAFTMANGGTRSEGAHTGSAKVITFTASKNWSGATSSNGAHTHTITDSAGVLGKSNTVQPPATQMYLYFFIGNYARPQADINIGELVELINERDFEGQVADGKAELNATKNNCIQEINSTGVGSRVLKTGDTMTGNLNINKNSGVVSITGTGYKGIVTKSTDIDYTLTDQVSLQGVRILSQDKNGQWFGYFQNAISSAGNIFTGMSARRVIDGTAKECAITCNVSNTGGVYTSAPTPGTGDNSTKIATTAFVNNQLNNKIKSYITETYVNGTSGYRIWSDKFCEQWGRAKPAAANNGTTEVTLLKAYKNTNGMCLVTSPDITFMSGGGINYGTSSAKFIANNKIRVKQATGSPEDSNMQWYTTGYIA